ncbi:MAG: Gfo/Idh/MocA family oxidoreductase [Chloroflexota bacterium]|nr:Gfo/Idh/MocA family oxidoreductase [Chloroflexota bacterium]
MRWIQAGVGRWGRDWTRLFDGTAGHELVAVVDPSPEARAWATGTLGLDPAMVVGEWAALPGTGADAVLVTTPPATHHEVAATALRAGFPTLVEKPLATTMEDASSLVSLAREMGQPLMVSQNYRYTKLARAPRAAIAAGLIGTVLAARIDFRRDTRTLFPSGEFRYTMDHPLVLDMAIHHFDLIRALTGDEPESVMARSWRVPDSPYAGDPACAALVGLGSGATVIYNGDWATHGPETGWNGDWEILGSDGRLTWRDDQIHVHRWLGGPVLVPDPGGPADGREGVLAEFAAALSEGRQPETSGADNLKSLALTLACVQSIEREEMVWMGAAADDKSPHRTV